MSSKRRKQRSFLGMLSQDGKDRGRHYDEKRVQYLVIWFRRTGDERYRTEIIEQCYPLILSILQKVGRFYNSSNRLFDNEDMFNESVIVIDKCIRAYKFDKNTKFITFVWISILRNARRFLSNNIINPNKIFVDSLEIFTDESYGSEGELPTSRYVEYEHEFNHHGILDCLTVTERRIVKLREADVKIDKICRMMRIKQSSYYRYMKSIKNKLRKELGDGDTPEQDE
jgi:RNA polymerase sigma factor (sigma-70 family)